MNKSRLVAFLGTGNYKLTTYRWKGLRVQSCYSTHAIAKILHEKKQAPTELHIVCTQDAKDKHGAGLSSCIEQDIKIVPKFCIIPKGSEGSELWKIFDNLFDAFSVGENQALIVDITLGYRSQPFFAAAVLAFLRAISDACSNLTVLYAGDIESEPTLVWDITLAIEVLDWAYALQLFIKTGRVGAVAELTERIGRSIAKQWATSKEGKPPRLKPFADSLRAFGDDLATIRTGDLLLGREGRPSSTSSLLKRLEEARSDIQRYLPPINRVLSKLEEMARSLGAQDDLTSPAGQDALANLARIYLEMERYVEAITTVREAWITRFAKTDAAWRPGSSFLDTERKKAENACRRALGTDYDTAFGQIRNDLNHGGMNHDPRSAKKVKDAVRDAVNNFKGGFERLSPSAKSLVGEPPVFVNLSNHPIAQWGEDQVQAAKALVGPGGIIRDVPFPKVEPTSTDLNYLYRLAEETIAKVKEDQGVVTHAMVQGEHTLTFLLVSKLQRLGIKCVAGTTDRLVETLPDGTKLSKFVFRGFREYPDLDW